MQWLILDVPYVRLVQTPEYLLEKGEASEAGGDDVTGNTLDRGRQGQQDSMETL